MTTPAWGSSTEQAVATFDISGQRMPVKFLTVLAAVKQVAAETNRDLGLLPADLADAISAAAAEIVSGDHMDQFPVDVYQTGSGTSTNMNCNEVIASLATRRLDASRSVHPNDHVNRGQSSNDVIPTAMHVSFARAIQHDLIPALERLYSALLAKSDEFWPVLKLARTHLQDATPIRLGQEFLGYAGQVKRCVSLANHATDQLRIVPLGGTAVGTGLNTHPDFASKACARLSDLVGVDVRQTPNHFAAQSTLDVVISAHANVKTIALSLWKIASDLRLLASGPHGGFAEILLPPSGVRSSIMPGKTPPAVIESLTMVVARVLGNEAVVSFAQTGSILELNVMMPVTIAAVLESVSLLRASTDNLTDRCIAGISATPNGPTYVDGAAMLVTALTPTIGYELAAQIATEAARGSLSVHEVAIRHGLDVDELGHGLDPYKMTEPSSD